MKHKSKELLLVSNKFYEGRRDDFFTFLKNEMEQYSIGDLAQAAGVADSTIRKFCNGTTTHPSSRTLLRYMYALGLKPQAVQAKFQLKLAKVG